MTVSVHVAAFEWKAGTDADYATKLLDGIRDLRSEIPGIHSIWTGPNSSRWAKNLTHCVVVVGESDAAIDAYRKHPQHALLAEKIEAIEEDGIGLDFSSV